MEMTQEKLSAFMSLYFFSYVNTETIQTTEEIASHKRIF